MTKIIIEKPVITEKSIDQTKNRYYTFKVNKSATKQSVKKAVERQFSVVVEKVTVLTRKGKTRRVGKLRRQAVSSSTKYARVKLAPDQTIDLFTVAK